MGGWALLSGGCCMTVHGLCSVEVVRLRELHWIAGGMQGTNVLTLPSPRERKGHQPLLLLLFQPLLRLAMQHASSEHT